MNLTFACPNCKSLLNDKNETYACTVCDLTFNNKNGYIDFIPYSDFYAGEIPKTEITELINNIDSYGYDTALKTLFSKHPNLHSYIIDNRRADFVYNGLGKRNNRCIDLGSGLGNISERVSHIFNEVYSVEAVKERIEFQKRRYMNAKIDNIIITRSNILKLPFKDNFFDYVICNGVLEWIGMMNTNLPPKDAQILFLKELKRIVSEDGTVYIGIENRIGLPFLLGEKDHSGIAYTSLLPRFLANIIVKKFGTAGGIYGDKALDTLNKEEERGYFTYTYSLWGYQSLLKKVGFNINSFWTLPTYNQPNFSGNIKNDLSVKGFINFLMKIHPNFKEMRFLPRIALSIAAKLPTSVIGFLTRLLSPSFLFYCSKKDGIMRLTDVISSKAASQNFITVSDGSTVKVLLFDGKGIPIKLAYIRRDINHIPDKILFHDKTKPNDYPIDSEKVWFSDWIEAKKVNPSCYQEMKSAVNWLIRFQDESKKSEMDFDFVTKEMDDMRSIVKKIPELSDTNICDIIDKYQSYLIKHNLNLYNCSEHGDFWHGNILVNESKEVFVIDWEYYRETGDPIFDFIFLILNTILHSHITLYEIVKRELYNHDIIELKLIFEKHLGFRMDFQIVIPFILLRYAIRRRMERGPQDKDWMKYCESLKQLSA